MGFDEAMGIGDSNVQVQNYIQLQGILKGGERNCEMAQGVKAFATKPDNLCLIFRSHSGRRIPASCHLIPTHSTPELAQMHYTYMHVKNF